MSTPQVYDEQVDAEIVEPEVIEPLNEREAEALDKRIRAASEKLTTSRDQLLDLLEEAARGQIHAALGFPSWTAWIKEAVQIVPADPAERKALAQLMSGKGMSVRAIAGALGVGKSTVNRDLSESTVPSGTVDKADNKVISLDGRNRPKHQPKKPEPEQGPLDEAPEPKQAEPEPTSTSADAATAVEPKPKPTPEPKQPRITAEFQDEIYNLRNCVQEFKTILEDERFSKVRNRLAKRHLDQVLDAINDLRRISEVLMGNANVDGADAT